jgi:predicted transcriptional regulator
MPALDSIESAREHLEFLSSSPERLALLTRLRGQSLSAAELGERAGVSNETVQRLLETGIECDWIVEDAENERHELTIAGDLVLQAYLGAQALDWDLFVFLTASKTRLDVLEQLESDSLSAAELSDDLPVTVPTVYRALNALEDRELLDWQDEPELTETGMDVHEEYHLLADTITWVTDHAETLNHLSDVARTLPARELVQSDGELVVNSMANPEAVLNHLKDRVEVLSPERIWCVLPSMCTFIERIGQPILERGTEIKVVVDEAVLDVARQSHPQALSAIADAQSAELFIHPEKLRFGLAILNDSVFVFIYDERSLIACLETTSEVLDTWAADVFQARYQAARS